MKIYDYTTRKLTKAETDKYGSSEAFREAQETYLDSREALGFDVRTFNERNRIYGKRGIPHRAFRSEESLDAYMESGVKPTRDRFCPEHRRHIDTIYRDWCGHWVFEKDDLFSKEDIMQEVEIGYAKGLASYEELEVKNGPVRSWCGAVTGNHMRDLLDKAKRRLKGIYGLDTQFDSLDNLDWYVQSPNSVENDIHKAQIEYVIDKHLIPKHAKMVKLYYGIGYGAPSTMEEVGEYFNCTKAAVNNLLKKLKKNEAFKKDLVEFSSTEAERFQNNADNSQQWEV